MNNIDKTQPFPKRLLRKKVATLEAYQGGKSREEVNRQDGINDPVKLASNESPLPISSKVEDAIAQALQNLAEYPDGSGYHLTKDLANKHSVKPEMICLGSGSSEILSLAVQSFCQSQRFDTLLFPKYSFIVYSMLAKIHGLEFQESKLLESWDIDFNDLEQSLDENTRVIFIASPSNPLGRHCSNDELFAFIERVDENTIVVLDQAYADFVDGIDETISWLNQFPNLLITRTFSKAYGLAGLRIGYGIANSQIINYLNLIRPPFNTSSLAQVAAQTALKDIQSLQATIDNNKKQLLRFEQWCQRHTIDYIASSANFVTFKPPKNADNLVKQLLRRGVIIRQLDNYALPEYVRISMGTTKQMDMFYSICDDIF